MRLNRCLAGGASLALDLLDGVADPMKRVQPGVVLALAQLEDGPPVKPRCSGDVGVALEGLEPGLQFFKRHGGLHCAEDKPQTQAPNCGGLTFSLALVSAEMKSRRKKSADERDRELAGLRPGRRALADFIEADVGSKTLRGYAEANEIEEWHIRAAWHGENLGLDRLQDIADALTKHSDEPVMPWHLLFPGFRRSPDYRRPTIEAVDLGRSLDRIRDEAQRKRVYAKLSATIDEILGVDPNHSSSTQGEPTQPSQEPSPELKRDR